jgi:hypothetical protein
MIYEVRTYTLRPGTVPDVERLWGEAYRTRQRHSRIAGFFRTEIGPLNEVVQIWPYADLAERAQVREVAVRDPEWPPDLSEFLLNQRVEIVTPFPFAPEWVPGNDGPFYELRQYTFRSNTLPAIMEAWKAALPARAEPSRPGLIGSVEIGPTANSFMHLWPYPSLDKRNEIRAAAVATGKWPVPGGRDRYLTQTNKILMPAPFSPAQ